MVSDISSFSQACAHYEAMGLGLGGWVRFADLPLADLPHGPGVYVVLWPADAPISFLTTSSAGFHKGRSPTVDVARLRDKWVPDTSVLYIGKATSLKDRLGAYRRQGGGSSAGHWGGRYLWQCSDANAARVGWMTTPGLPGDVEYDLIAEFRSKHDGRLPFANLTKGSRQAG